MIRKSDLIVFVFFGAIIIQEGSSLRCYSCSSKQNANCIDPARHRMPPTFCNETALHSIKLLAHKSVSRKIAEVYDIDLKHGRIEGPYDCVKQITKEIENGEEVVLRGCQVSITENPKFCNKIETVGGKTITHCSTCNTDDCNLAPTNLPLKWLTLVALVSFLTITNFY
ncbi:uncharacterized protein LOC108735038 [Agrilus planipennis]|uniref:Uncharacterized protein LOC108735038 n=1 Tax=Agrilus planipennis TaxID=224129 RepID=A0A1W4WPE1_AGRPL|nr:uncharacterized protein LOC108735038 [Agrilus planipennis]